MRTLADVTLDLNGLTVIIGENGTGKSTLLEAFEILRRAATYPNFLGDFNQVHGGVDLLRRRGEKSLSLGIETSTGASYQLVVGDGGIEHEWLKLGGAVHIDRTRGDARLFNPTRSGMEEVDVGPTPSRNRTIVDPASTMLFAFSHGPGFEVVRSVADLLRRIEVHVPFEVMPRWVARVAGRQTAMRDSLSVQEGTRLMLLGDNLAKAYEELQARPVDQWETTLSYVRLGIGDEIEKIVTKSRPGGQGVDLAIRYRGRNELMYANMLSEGQLSYLAFIALLRLDEGRSLLAVDEPELHLHPEMVTRIVDLFETAAENYPVVLATQSDRLLDSLLDPAGSVVICDLEGQRGTRLRRLDAKRLARWLERYQGLGDVRGTGHLRSLLKGT